MTAWTTFYDDVMPDVPGCETALVVHELRRAAIRLCERSSYHRLALDPIDVVSGTATYNLTSPDAALYRVCGVTRVKYDGNRLRPSSASALDDELQDWPAASGEVVVYIQESPTTLRLVRNPDVSIEDGLVVTVALAPAPSAATLADVMYNDWRDAIVSGAKSALMAMQKKPWSNPELALYYRSLFDYEVGAAAARASREFGRAPLRTRPV